MSRKARLVWFGYFQEARQRIRRKSDSGDCTTYMGEESEEDRSRDFPVGCVNRDMRAIGTTKDEVRGNWQNGWRRIVSASA